MREIKFRAWGVLKEKAPRTPRMFEIADGWSFEFAADGFTLTMLGPGKGFDSQVYPPHFTEGLAVMQFTGLKDKNGKEIYEGDICLLTLAEEQKAMGDAEHMINYGKSVSVYWEREQARFYFNGSIPFGWGGHESIKIIGNIYENPELLK